MAIAKKYPIRPETKCLNESLYIDCFWILKIKRLEIKTKIIGIIIIGEVKIWISLFLWKLINVLENVMKYDLFIIILSALILICIFFGAWKSLDQNNLTQESDSYEFLNMD